MLHVLPMFCMSRFNKVDLDSGSCDDGESYKDGNFLPQGGCLSGMVENGLVMFLEGLSGVYISFWKSLGLETNPKPGCATQSCKHGMNVLNLIGYYNIRTF